MTEFDYNIMKQISLITRSHNIILKQHLLRKIVESQKLGDLLFSYMNKRDRQRLNETLDEYIRKQI